jgi:hypothetical protein
MNTTVVHKGAGYIANCFHDVFKFNWHASITSMGCSWQQRAAEEHHAPNTAEYRRQQAEAWQAEKVEAQFNKVLRCRLIMLWKSLALCS